MLPPVFDVTPFYGTDKLLTSFYKYRMGDNLKSVLGIRDWLMDPDPTLDPTHFFSDFKDAKKDTFFIFFSYILPAGTLSTVVKFNSLLKKNFVLNFILQALFQSVQHISEKRIRIRILTSD